MRERFSFAKAFGITKVAELIREAPQKRKRKSARTTGLCLRISLFYIKKLIIAVLCPILLRLERGYFPAARWQEQRLVYSNLSLFGRLGRGTVKVNGKHAKIYQTSYGLRIYQKFRRAA